ncbi:MAG TPA: hypothetical protein VFI27_18795 [candidate division Zixibacteria bacterium]|nr:hypothetical protein [candidate division Zixibacteria bacterium]
MSSNFELKLSFLVLLFLTVVYVAYELLAIPAGGHPFGHALGIIGAVLMLMTEFLYSARKRWGIFHVGQVRHWLSFHIFTGIIGPFLVLMHTGLEFRGLAGITVLLTVLVVLSGFIGRYIYTSVPRSLAGVELNRRDLEKELASQREELAKWSVDKPARVQLLVTEYSIVDDSRDELSSGEILTRRYREWQSRRKLHGSIKQLEREEQARMKDLEQMINRQQRLIWQINSLQTVRRMMGSWHTLHIPMGITLFSAMTIHIIATIYYGGI